MANHNGQRCLYAFTVLGMLAFAVSGCGRSKEVDAVHPRRGELRQSFTEQARTRLDRTWLVTLPVDGRIGRVDLDPGDPVAMGEVLFEYDRVALEEAATEARAAVRELEASLAVLMDSSLEETALVETRAIVEATEIALLAADKQVEAERIHAEWAERQKERIRQQFEVGVVSEEKMESATLTADTALISLREREFTRAALSAIQVAVKTGPQFVMDWMARKELQRLEYLERLAQARARLTMAEHRFELSRVQSPINGVVLERYEDGDRSLPAGSRIVLLGNLAQLEVVADVLTQDALRLEPGMKVMLRPAVRAEPISGSVRLIEPKGFTRLSSLGVEQQRVNVIVSLDERPADLGVDYRLTAEFQTGARDDALTVPRFSVIQDPDGSLYVLAIANGRLERRDVTIGLESDLELEILEGLGESDLIVHAPDAGMREGDRVRARQRSR